MRGYAGKYLDIDLSTKSIENLTLDEKTLRNYIGGRGLATKILWDRLGDRWERVNPIGPENIFCALTGPLTGYFPGARLCVSGKSPQSNGIVGSTLACEFSVELKCAGYDGLIISGKAPKPVYISITDSTVEIKDASHLWGKDGKETVKRLTKEGIQELERRNPERGLWKEPASIYIGPAGEKMVRVASVNTKWAHAAGYGGYGAVMGSKNIKAITAKGTGPLPEIANLARTLELAEKISAHSRSNTVVPRQWGTGASGYDVGSNLSSEPVRNWQDEWHDEEGFGVTHFERRTWVKRCWADFGCPLACLKIAVVKNGPYKGAITDNPDYENQAYLGPNLGIFIPEENVYLVSLIDDLGLCGIQTGNLLGFTAELYQRKIVTEKDLDGIELEWGNTDAFASLIKKIAEREGIGDTLAEGTYRAALKISKQKGIDAAKYAVVSKGIAIGAHGIRSLADYPTEMSYACSVQGGDHTSIAHPEVNSGNSELQIILHDSGVYCWFNTFGVPMELVWDIAETITGWEIGPDEWFKTTARRILHTQRAALLIGGPDLTWTAEKDDVNPPRFHEPLPSGPHAGKMIDRMEAKEATKEYYEDIGWDENGIPKSEELKRLGLDQVNKKLEKLRF